MEATSLLYDPDSDDSGHGSETVSMAKSRNRLREASRESFRSAQLNYSVDHQIQDMDSDNSEHGSENLSRTMPRFQLQDLVSTESLTSAQCSIQTQSHYSVDPQTQGLDLGNTFHGKDITCDNIMDTAKKKETTIKDEARAVRVCDKFRQKYHLQSWPGYQDKEIVIVSFLKNLTSSPILPPDNFESFRVILRTDSDNSICKTPTPRLLKEDVKFCKPIIAEFGPKLMKEHSNISMIIVSPYRLKNGTASSRVCIVIYCRGKGVIPFQEKPFPTSLDGVEVDVREGYCSFGMRNSQLQRCNEIHQNLRIGVEIAPSGGPAGTLGGFLRDQRNTYFLTCAHVLIPNQCLTRSFPEFSLLNDCWRYCNYINVFQPAHYTVRSVGRVETAIFQHSDPCVTSVDAALVSITDRNRLPTDPYMTKQPRNTRNLRSAGFSDSNPPKYSSGAIIPQMDEPHIGHMVIKCGATTGLTHGVLAMDGGIFRMENQELHLQGIQGQQSPRIVMYHQYLIEFLENNPFFQLGDSGSFVFMHDDGDLKCIGMAIGDTTHGGCIVTPIEAILDSLNIGYDGSTSPFLPFHSGDDSDDATDDDNDDSDGGDSDYPDPGPSRKKRKKDPRGKNRRGKRPSPHHQPMDFSDLHNNSVLYFNKDTYIKISGDNHVFHQYDGEKLTQIVSVAALKNSALISNPANDLPFAEKKNFINFNIKTYVLKYYIFRIVITMAKVFLGNDQHLSLHREISKNINDMLGLLENKKDSSQK